MKYIITNKKDNEHYYLKSKEYADYMDTQQEINLAIKEAFEKQKIEFAYPTQTILVSK